MIKKEIKVFLSLVGEGAVGFLIVGWTLKKGPFFTFFVFYLNHFW